MILSDSMVLLKYNAMTAPGWIMSVLWLASLLLVVLLFEEPDQKVRTRVHLLRTEVSAKKDWVYNGALRPCPNIFEC